MIFRQVVFFCLSMFVLASQAAAYDLGFTLGQKESKKDPSKKITVVSAVTKGSHSELVGVKVGSIPCLVVTGTQEIELSPYDPPSMLIGIIDKMSSGDLVGITFKLREHEKCGDFMGDTQGRIQALYVLGDNSFSQMGPFYKTVEIEQGALHEKRGVVGKLVYNPNGDIVGLETEGCNISIEPIQGYYEGYPIKDVFRNNMVAVTLIYRFNANPVMRRYRHIGNPCQLQKLGFKATALKLAGESSKYFNSVMKPLIAQKKERLRKEQAEREAKKSPKEKQLEMCYQDCESHYWTTNPKMKTSTRMGLINECKMECNMRLKY